MDLDLQVLCSGLDDLVIASLEEQDHQHHRQGNEEVGQVDICHPLNDIYLIRTLRTLFVGGLVERHCYFRDGTEQTVMASPGHPL